MQKVFDAIFKALELFCAIVLFALRRMRELDGTLELRAIRTQPYRVMKAAGLDKLIDLQRSMSDEVR